MSLGARILQLLDRREMTQAELARRVGMKQPSINALIHKNKTGSRNLHQIAQALGTTTAFLAGETDDPEAGAPEEVPLDYFQRELLDLVAMLTPADKKALIQIVRSMVGVADPKNFKGFSETLHSPKQEYRGRDSDR
ncbi:MAG: helix-turn-helix domain-containing protein [Sphingomonas sp.]